MEIKIERAKRLDCLDIVEVMLNTTYIAVFS